MTSTLDRIDGTPGAPTPPPGPEPRRMPTWVVVGAVALAAAVAWVPALTVFPSSDEGGFLLLASQWHPGTSLYGSYWVDRPPVLILLFQLADALGGVIGLRLVGVAGVVLGVLLGAALPSALAPAGTPLRARRRAALLSAFTTAALLTSPLFGAMEVDGELLAVPAVLAGCLLLLRAQRTTGPRRARLVLLAGLVGSAAWLTKQDVADVFVLGAALAVAGRLHHGRSLRQALGDLACLTAGLVAGVGGALVVAAQHGTSPAALWSAVVTFRFRASEVIAWSSSGATPQRFWMLLAAFVLSGAPLVIWYAARSLRGTVVRPLGPGGPTWPLLTLLAWEAVAVGGGGSYWLHYIVGLVPGITLLVAAAATRPALGRRLQDGLAWAVTAAVASTLVAVPVAVSQMPAIRGDDAAVSTYLRVHAAPGDTGVVAYGHPDILEQAGLSSPYPDLWSLPVRVRDPHLARFRRVLTTDRPRWLVAAHGDLASWGLDSSRAQRVVDRDYRTVFTSGDWSVLERTR
ncbi:hypothetical protein [Nocardioides iriomotensis]|uniref:hypothetical protein n=1 Tax=Nocardioides iriomotensis TaxID=715784 RepID=UPI0013EAD6D7|nr:hypothetical protein [Nocardioides iriomotensis]